MQEIALKPSSGERAKQLLESFGKLHELHSDLRLERMHQLLVSINECPRTSDSINVLSLCRVGDDEVRHSSILAWLLNMSGSHGAGNRFFEAFLMVCQIDPQPFNLPYRVRTEYGRAEAIIDIVVYRRNSFVLYLEHKVSATEGTDQLNREHRDLHLFGNALKVPSGNRFAVFLTPDGRWPVSGNRDDWRLLSHHNLANAFETVVNEMPEGKARWFVSDWLKTISEWR